MYFYNNFIPSLQNLF